MTIQEQLEKPFRANEIEWRVQQCGISNNKPWAKVLCYVQNRAIQQRLDDIFTPFGWKNEFIPWRDEGQLCGISIYDSDKKEWITKWDGAEETDIEEMKGGLSNSMKRAAVQWGIGRYLYKLEATFAECSLEKKAGWIQAKTKDGKEIYWTPPELPEWAVDGPPKSPKKPSGNKPTEPEFYTCASCGNLFKDTTYKGKTYTAKAMYDGAVKKYGKALCSVCGAKYLDSMKQIDQANKGFDKVLGGKK